MKLYRRIIYALSSVTCAGGIIICVIPTSLISRISALAIIVLSIAIVVCIGRYRNVVKNKIAKLKDKHSDEKAELIAKLDKSDQTRVRLRAVIEELEMQNERLKRQLEECSTGLNPAEVYLQAFNLNHVHPFLEYLRNIQMPLNDDDKQKIIDTTINLALLSIDIADSYKWTINNREEQKINCSVVTNNITSEEALDKAITITGNPMVTPKWIRAFSTALHSVVSEKCRLIISGYKIHK